MIDKIIVKTKKHATNISMSRQKKNKNNFIKLRALLFEVSKTKQKRFK